MSSSKIAFLKDNLETETESVFQEEIKKPKRVGRKPKLKGTKLSKRVTFLISEKDAEILGKKRRAGDFGEIDESVFVKNGLRTDYLRIIKLREMLGTIFHQLNIKKICLG